MATQDEFSGFAAAPNGQDEFAGFTSADPAPPATQTVGGAVQAGSSGVNAGVMDVLGLPMDTATNAVNLIKSGAEAAYLATGHLPPTSLDPTNAADVWGTSEWLKKQIRGAGGSNLIDTQQDTHANRLIHGTTEAVAPGLVGGEGATARQVARTVTGAAAAGAGSQEAAERGYGAVGQQIAGLAGGLAGNAGAEAASSARQAVRSGASAAVGAVRNVLPASSDARAAAQRTELGYGAPEAPQTGALQPGDLSNQTVEGRAWTRTGLTPTTDANGKVTGSTVTDPQAYEQAKADYAALPGTAGGKVINTDEARELSPDYSASKDSRSALAADVHEPSSAFTKQLYAEKLAQPPAAGEAPRVMFTAGGTGAGKTSAIAGNDELQGIKDSSQIVYDTNMNNLSSSRDKIQQALNAGKDVHVAYVYRDPAEAFANGTLPRAERMGRTVPIQEQANTHAGSYATVAQLRQDFADDPRVTFTALDNSRGKGNQVIVPFDSLAGKRYNVTADELRPVLENQLQAGRISQRVYDGTLGEKAVQGQAPRAGQGLGAVAGTTGAGVEVANGGQARGAGNGQTPAQGNGGPSGRVQSGARQAPPAEVEFTPPAEEGTEQAALPSAVQAQRARTLRAIGLKEARTSAITGDTKAAATDFQTSKLDNAAGERMNGVLENERSTLRDFAGSLADQSGGTRGLDQPERYARGQSMTAPIEAYDKALEQQVKRHYAIADQRAQGQPIALSGLQQFMATNRSHFLGTVEGKQLLEGVQARMGELGLSKANETFNPATVQQAEQLRQYLNDNWTPRTARLIGALKGSLDEDVAKAAGADVYREARAVRTLRAKMLEEPKGVSKLLAPDDKLGINRQVALEDVPKYVASLPVDQFNQVVSVLKQAGSDKAIEPLAVKAYNEIRAHFANHVLAAGDSTQGMWNAKAVNQYLSENRQRMAQVFTPDEMGRFKALNDAGGILRVDRTYPGAAAQGHNLVMRGVLGAAEHGATAAGALLGHIPGLVVGHGVSKVAGRIDEGSLKGAVEKRITKF